MNTRYRVIAIGVAGACFVALLLLFHLLENRRLALAPQGTPASASSAQAIVKHDEESSSKVQNSSPLESARRCAAYIQEVYESVPPERGTTRHQLLALRGMLFISDYVQDAKAGSLPLSKQGIVEAYAEISPSTLPVTSYLQTYLSSDLSLSDRYEQLRKSETAGKQVREIESVLGKSGLTVERESDLLLDCLRLAALLTEVREMYGPRENLLDSSIPNAPEEAVCTDAMKKVFQYRLQNRYGISASKSAAVVLQLASNSLSGLSPAEFEIPVQFQ